MMYLISYFIITSIISILVGLFTKQSEEDEIKIVAIVFWPITLPLIMLFVPPIVFYIFGNEVKKQIEIIKKEQYESKRRN